MAEPVNSEFQAALAAARAGKRTKVGPYDVNFNRVWRDGKVVAFVNGKVFVPSTNSSPEERAQLKDQTIGDFEQVRAADRVNDALPDEEPVDLTPEPPVPPRPAPEPEEKEPPTAPVAKPAVTRPTGSRTAPRAAGEKEPIVKEPSEIDSDESKRPIFGFPTLRLRK